MGDIEQAVSFMEMIAKDNSHGYAQDNRKGTPDYDCSSLVGTALNKAGFNVNPLSTTRTLYNQLIKCGFKSIGINDKRQRGDIFLSPGHHVVMCTDDKNIVHASINEKYKTTNGTPGDQTGKEIYIRNFYMPSYGWTYHLRYPQQSSALTNQKAIDISEYNIITDYKALSNQIKNVLIRCGYRGGTSGTIVEDKSFAKHIKNCMNNGMNISVYFYDQSINENEAIEQAEWVLDKIKPYSINLPIFIDSEYTKKHTGRADSLSKEQRTKNIIAFCNRINKANYIGGVYASNSWFQSMVEFDKLKNYIIWCARYSTNKPTINKYDIWQYGSENYSWATGAIDTNIIYSDLKCTQTGVKPAVIPTSDTQSGITPEKKILLMGQVNIKEGTLNVRKAPSTNSQVVLQLQKGAYVQLRGDLGDWYRMDIGYVSKEYIKEVHGIVTGDKLRVRSTPDASSQTNIITTLPVNTEVIICTAGNGWYYVLLNDGRTGWVSGMYITLK
jgi:GH25 family lysozyme M1 (1,4-beta-N-acetylmuramidase)